MISIFNLQWKNTHDGVSVFESALYAALQIIAQGNQRLADHLHDSDTLPRFSARLLETGTLSLVTLDNEVYAAVARATGLRPKQIALTDIMNQPATRSTIKLSFATPTTFRASGVNDCDPSPAKIFKSLKRRYEALAGQPLYEYPDEPQLSTVRLAIQTHNIQFRQHKAWGFTGHVIVRVPSDTTLFHGLAELAKYTGVGAKTAYGWGMVV